MLNNCLVYRASKWEKFAAKFFPYHLPFINKRKRVNIRNYFRYRYKARFMNDMVNQLKGVYVNKLPESTKEIKWDDWEWNDWEWEIVNEKLNNYEFL